VHTQPARYIPALRRGALRRLPAAIAALTTAGLTFTLTALGAPPAHATVVTVDYGCRGSEVIRCITLNYDDVNNRFQLYASIQDIRGASSYTVKVNNIHVNTTRNSDNDGWHDVSDTGRSGVHPCRAASLRVTYGADFSWYRVGGTGVTSGKLERTKTFRCR
jgi:hypothetical protein